MPRQTKKIDEWDDNPPLTASQVLNAKKLQELPESLRQKLSRRPRGPQKAPTKERISILLSRDVAASLRATGTGWQPRVDSILRAWLKRNGKMTA